jgi:hypothetical protein
VDASDTTTGLIDDHHRTGSTGEDRMRQFRPYAAMIVAGAALLVAVANGANAAGPKPFTGFKVEEVHSPPVQVGRNAVQGVIKHCPSGYHILSGGFVVAGSITLQLTASQPVANATAWQIAVVNTPLGQPGSVETVAYCFKLSR